MPKTKTRRRPRRRPIESEDLLRLRIATTPQVSPDGERIAWTEKTVGKRNRYRQRLMISSTSDLEPTPFTNGEKDTQPRWSPDGSTIAFLRGGKDVDTQIHVIAAHGGEARCLTMFPEGSFGELRWAPNGRYLAVAFREQDAERTRSTRKSREKAGLSEPPLVIDTDWYRFDGDGVFNDRRFQLFIVDAETGDHRCLYRRDTLGDFSFDIAPDSRQVVVATNRARRAMLQPWKAELLRIDVASGKATAISGLPLGPKTAVRWSPDGRHIAYAGREGDDGVYSVENLELWICDARRGQARCLTAGTDHCLMAIAITDCSEASFAPALEFAADGSRVFYRLGRHGTMQIAAAPVDGGRPRVLTRGEHDLELGTVSADGKRIAAVVSTPTRPPEVAVFRGGNRARSWRLEAVAERNRELLDGLELSAPRSHWIRAADGHELQVWTLRPPGAPARRRTPAVLEIHGGPHAQYGCGFFHEFQLLAASGYTVVYANPRGSKGYGRDHCAAIRGQWGSADWTDMQAVIDFMKKRADVDSARLGVMGGSYGGYMTNWIIGHCHDFKGAITDRCVSNLVSMQGTSDFMEKPDHYFPGNAWDRPEALWEQSPLRYFGAVRTPTLIIHSEGDLRCNIEQAEQIHTVLKLRNVPTRFIRYPRGASHGMSRGGPPDLRLHRLRHILDWWRKYLG